MGLEYDSELWWFWNEANGDMGLRAAPLEPSYGGGMDVHEQAYSRMRHVDRCREIELALGALEEEQVKLLRLAHTPIPPAHRPRLAPLGALALVVIELAPSPEWVLERIGTGTKLAPELKSFLEKSQRRVKQALTAFEVQRKEWKRIVKGTSRGSTRNA